MVSIKQIEANRQNAQKSTGPKTAEGKAKSSQNAVTHGMTSRRPVLSIEDKNEFDLHANEMLVWLDPQDPVEKILARRAAMLSWRLQRASVYETLVLENLLTAENAEQTEPGQHLGKIIAADFQNSQTLTKIQRYETQLERSMLRCVNTLKRIRDSKLMTYSKIKEYVRGGEEQPEPYFQDENADARFPAHLEKEMHWRRPQKRQNEPISKVAEASSFGLNAPASHDELTQNTERVLNSIAADDSTNLQSPAIDNHQSSINNFPLCSSVPSEAKKQNEPISNASPIDNNGDFQLHPRWSTVVLNDVGYSEKARSKMTKVEREEAADRVLLDMKDPKQYLLDRNLIIYPDRKFQNEPISGVSSLESNALSFQKGVPQNGEGKSNQENSNNLAVSVI